MLSTSICEGIFGEGSTLILVAIRDGRLHVARLSHFNGSPSSLGNLSEKKGVGVARGRGIGCFR